MAWQDAQLLVAVVGERSARPVSGDAEEAEAEAGGVAESAEAPPPTIVRAHTTTASSRGLIECTAGKEEESEEQNPGEPGRHPGAVAVEEGEGSEDDGEEAGCAHQKTRAFDPEELPGRGADERVNG
jgi:hypothetical protein